MMSENFTSIDLNFASTNEENICAVSFAKFRNRELIGTSIILIKPIKNNYNPIFYKTHNIRARDTKNSPTLADAFEKIKNQIGDDLIVIHNKKGYDQMNYLLDKKTGEKLTNQVISTRNLTKDTLKNACVTYGINFDDTKDTLLKATATGELYTAYYRKNPSLDDNLPEVKETTTSFSELEVTDENGTNEVTQDPTQLFHEIETETMRSLSLIDGFKKIFKIDPEVQKSRGSLKKIFSSMIEKILETGDVGTFWVNRVNGVDYILDGQHRSYSLHTLQNGLHLDHTAAIFKSKIYHTINELPFDEWPEIYRERLKSATITIKRLRDAPYDVKVRIFHYENKKTNATAYDILRINYPARIHDVISNFLHENANYKRIGLQPTGRNRSFANDLLLYFFFFFKHDENYHKSPHFRYSREWAKKKIDITEEEIADYCTRMDMFLKKLYTLQPKKTLIVPRLVGTTIKLLKNQDNPAYALFLYFMTQDFTPSFISKHKCAMNEIAKIFFVALCIKKQGKEIVDSRSQINCTALLHYANLAKDVIAAGITNMTYQYQETNKTSMLSYYKESKVDYDFISLEDAVYKTFSDYFINNDEPELISLYEFLKRNYDQIIK